MVLYNNTKIVWIVRYIIKCVCTIKTYDNSNKPNDQKIYIMV